MSIKSKMALKMARKLAKNIDKEQFLSQLRLQWEPHLKGKAFDIDQELINAKERIKAEGFEEVFKIAGITDEDIKKVLGEIRGGLEY